jgi:hypothetical protein
MISIWRHGKVQRHTVERTVVGQSIQSWARPTLIRRARGYEGMCSIRTLVRRVDTGSDGA